MKMKSSLSVAKVALSAVAFALAFPADAAYVNFTNSQAVGSVNLNDLTNAVNWSDGLYPTSDKEYRVHSGRYAGVGDSLSFPGKKLTIGQKGGSDGYLVIRGTGSTIGFQNDGLFLERGQLYFNQGYQTHSITGNITVTAPTSKSFSWRLAVENCLQYQGVRILRRGLRIDGVQQLFGGEWRTERSALRDYLRW